jgi:hypothetical protein
MYFLYKNEYRIFKPVELAQEEDQVRKEKRRK